MDKAIVKLSIEHFKETAKDRDENIEFDKKAFYKLLDSMENVLAELDNKDKQIEELKQQNNGLLNLNEGLTNHISKLDKQLLVYLAKDRD